MIIAGGDLSMNSTGIWKMELNDSLDVVNNYYMGFSTVKKVAEQNKNINYYKKDWFRDGIDKNLWMISRIGPFLDSTVRYFGMEGYSYGSKGVLAEIGEYCGGVKTEIYLKGILIRIYDPNSIKMFATSNGAAKKKMMWDAFVKINGVPKDLPVVEKEDGISPTSDVVDAYWICEMLRLELKLRKGLVLLKDLNEEKIRIFNRVTKKYPQNILATPFLEFEERHGN